MLHSCSQTPQALGGTLSVEDQQVAVVPVPCLRSAGGVMSTSPDPVTTSGESQEELLLAEAHAALTGK